MRKIFIGDVEENVLGTPIMKFKKAFELSTRNDFNVSTNDAQFIEALEVLCGENNITENDKYKNEQLLLSMAKELERKNKIIWKSMWIIMIVSMIALFAGIFLTAFLIPEGVLQFVTILGICIVFLIPCFYALKLEVSVGAYKCKNCGHELIPSYSQALWAMHRGTTRYLKCPNCNKRTWCKKILKKNSNS